MSARCVFHVPRWLLSWSNGRCRTTTRSRRRGGRSTTGLVVVIMTGVWSGRRLTKKVIIGWGSLKWEGSLFPRFMYENGCRGWGRRLIVVSLEKFVVNLVVRIVESLCCWPDVRKGDSSTQTTSTTTSIDYNIVSVVSPSSTTPSIGVGRGRRGSRRGRRCQKFDTLNFAESFEVFRQLFCTNILRQIGD
jgi:hypothetical protein